jgi:hypothetical protein
MSTRWLWLWLDMGHYVLLRGKSLDTPQVHHPPAVERTSTQVTDGYCCTASNPIIFERFHNERPS